MEIMVGGVADDGNSTNSNNPPPQLPPPTNSSYSILPNNNQALNGVGILSNFRQRNDILVGGTFDVSTRAFIAREIEKSKIKEEILTYGYLKRRRELEEEAIKELISDRGLAVRQGEGVSLINSPLFSLQSGLRGLTSNSWDTVALDERLAMVNRLDGGTNARLMLVNRLEGAMDRRIPVENRVDNVIDTVLPLGNRLDNMIDGRASLGNLPDSRTSDSLPFQRQPGGTSGVVCKPVIDLRKSVPLPKTATPEPLAGSKRKLETQTIDKDDGAALVSKSKKSQLGWCCELCQVRATSEQGLKDHLNGKRHKAKEKTMQKTTSVSNHSNKSGSPTEETEKSNELAASTVTTSTNLNNVASGNEDVKNVDASSPKKQHAESNGGSELGEKQNTEEFKDIDTDFKFWCKMCEVGTTNEASMTAHRAGKKHMSLLKEKGGGVIAIKTMPDDVQYVDLSRNNDTAIKEKEASLSNVDGQTAIKEKEASLGNVDGQTAIKEKEASVSNVDEQGGEVEANETETTDKCTIEAQ